MNCLVMGTSLNLALPTFYVTSTLQDENIYGIEFSDLARICQIHGSSMSKLWFFDFHLYKLSLRDTKNYNNKLNLI